MPRRASQVRRISTDSASEQFVLSTIEKLRRKLLDLTTRNPLISFKHSARSRRHVRVIDELPDHLFARLEAGAALKFKSLGEETSEPEDEKTIQFRRALDAAKLEEPEYRQKLEELGDDPGERTLERLDQELRARLRERLGMVPRRAKEKIEPADVARRRGLDPSFDLPLGQAEDADEPASKHADLAIQTLLFEEPMEQTLARVRGQVALSISETGVNPLFCVFGFLEWYEDANSEVALYAPLLLYPLDINRELARGQYQYTIRSTGEDVRVNVAVAERLKRDFDLVLPQFDEDADETPETYFAKVQTVIESKQSWKMRRWITVGLFSFARIAMYHDLDPDKWEPHGGIGSHPKLGPLLGGGTAGGDGNGSTYSADESGDSVAEAELVIPLIADADSSQLSAIQDVLSGRDLVIEGPPGTGKSQTITNIIAASLASGKSVLFLAEKMAALNVVKKRLDDAGLGTFCLELHSTKAGRKDTFAALGRRLELQQPRPVEGLLNASLRSLEGIRKALRDCVEALAQPAGKLDMTTQQLLWRCHRIRSQTAGLPSEIDELSYPDAEELTEIEVGDVIRVAEWLERARGAVLQVCASIREHSWYGVARHDLDLITAEDTVRRVERLASVAGRAQKSLAAIKALTDWACEKITDLDAGACVAELSPPDPMADNDLITGMADSQTLVAVEQFIAESGDYESLQNRIRANFTTVEAAEQVTCGEISRIAELLQDAALNEAAVSDMKRLAEDAERKAAAWAIVNRLLQQIVQTTESSTPTTVDSERSLVEAAELAEQARDRIVARRTNALTAPGASDALKRGAEKVKTLRGQRDALTERYVVEGTPDPATLRQHAAAMRSAPLGPFAFFSSAWRRARATYRTLCKMSFKAKRLEMAAVLDELAQFKEGLASFDNDEELAHFAGGAVKGADSDFAPTLEVSEWADRARLTIPATSEIGLQLRRLLFDGSTDRIEQLAALSKKTHFNDLRKVLKSSSSGDHKVSDRAETARTRARASVAIRDDADRLKLKSDLRLSHCAQLADDLRRAGKLRDSMNASRTVANVMEASFRGHLTKTPALAASAAYVRRVIEAKLPIELRQWMLRAQALERFAQLLPLCREVAQVQADFKSVVEGLQRVTPINFSAWLGVGSPYETNAAELHAHAERCASDPEGLQILIDDARALHEAHEKGLSPLLDLLQHHPLPMRGLGNAARRLIFQSMARTAIARSPALANFTGDQHEERRKQFRELDHRIKKLRQLQIVADLARTPIDPGSNAGPKNNWSGKALVQKEAVKQKRYISIRDLLDRAGRAVQQLMPCFMMSPLSVAQFITPGKLTFDLIVMDEASQLRPEDAIGAIARGSQVVIVGDPKQLPPTNFFMGGTDGAIEEEDETTAADEESILDQALSLLRPARRLRWHYRSRHSSLIAFSNKEFYDNDLIVFPTPFHDTPDFGVRYVPVPEGRYRSRVNIPEAQLVAAEAVSYSQKHPDRSLGIVTLNQPQSELIAMEIDRLAAENEAFEAWRRKHQESLEPFFVKNLENVQGDERDVIFISTVYGQDEQGNFHQRFGPINNQGGHRRLNVLFTRAKCQTVVFSSMDPSNIRVDETSAWGVRALKGYLKYAKDGILDQPIPTGREPESDFEIAVIETLRAAGFEAVPQVGVVGYFVDIGVRHPSRPGEFVLGVECDGAMYHSARSARDRDRLRQEVLERLKWRIHRIWSLDWYRNNKRESERLLKALQVAIAASDS